MKKSTLLTAVIVILLAVLVLLVYIAAGLGKTEPTDPSETTETITQTDPSTTQSTTASEPTTEPLPLETTAPTETLPEPKDEDFVRIRDYIPDLVVDLKYATEDNFTGVVIYDFTEPWLRYGTVKKLMAVQETLKKQGLGLKLWDGFRPTSAQEKLWNICPDPTYVSKPGTGSQSHCRGIAVDVTLVDSGGSELVMPTDFDDFSDLADRDYADCSAEAARNASVLEEVMEQNGFKPYFGEWWHYSDTVSYDIANDFEP